MPSGGSHFLPRMIPDQTRILPRDQRQGAKALCFARARLDAKRTAELAWVWIRKVRPGEDLPLPGRALWKKKNKGLGPPGMRSEAWTRPGSRRVFSRFGRGLGAGQNAQNTGNRANSFLTGDHGEGPFAATSPAEVLSFAPERRQPVQPKPAEVCAARRSGTRALLPRRAPKWAPAIRPRFGGGGPSPIDFLHMFSQMDTALTMTVIVHGRGRGLRGKAMLISVLPISQGNGFGAQHVTSLSEDGALRAWRDANVRFSESSREAAAARGWGGS